MRQNIQRTEQRQGNLNNLEGTTDDLVLHSQQFKRGTNRVMKQFRWKNLRMWGWIFLGCAIIAIIIGLGVLTPGFQTMLP